MNPLKHMVAILGSAAVTSLLFASLPDRDAQAAARERQQAAGAAVNTGTDPGEEGRDLAQAPGAMPVVIIKGKRPNARDKRRLAMADSV